MQQGGGSPMKRKVFALVGGLALSCGAFSPTLADEVADPFVGLTAAKEAQLESTRGGVFVLKPRNILGLISAPSEPVESVAPELSNIVVLAAKKAGDVATGIAGGFNFGDGIRGRIPGTGFAGFQDFGLRLGESIRAMATTWTDHNIHDPG